MDGGRALGPVGSAGPFPHRNSLLSDPSMAPGEEEDHRGEEEPLSTEAFLDPGLVVRGFK